MKQKLLTIGLILLIAGLLFAIVWGSKSKKEKTLSSANSQIENETATPVSDSSDELIFYYGVSCPHCKEVEEWMEENKLPHSKLCGILDESPEKFVSSPSSVQQAARFSA